MPRPTVSPDWLQPAPRGFRTILARGVIAILSLVLFAPAPQAQAQELGRMLFTVGTTAEEQGEPWAYVLWQATEPDLLYASTFAVYSKPGGFDSAQRFERRSIVGVQTDPLTIRAILERSRHLTGDDALAELEQRVRDLFHDVIPDGDIPLEEQLSAVIQGALGDPSLQENLILLGRLFPAVSLCLGHAWAGPISGTAETTFEVREHDPDTGGDLRVVGRVAVEAHAPVVLPAPGRARDASLSDSRGHLNVRLLWSEPEELRRYSLLQYGFNVWRVNPDYAEDPSNNWHTTPPSSRELRKHAETFAEVSRVNRLPVLTDRDLTETEAAELAAFRGEDDFFFIDDNDRNLPGGEGFRDGDEFYYFLTARDVLGRDGHVSPGTLVQVCDRMPPMPPVQVRVENHYEYSEGRGHQALKISWKQNADQEGEGTPTSGYYVYRWDSIEEMHQHSGNPLYNLINARAVAHDPDSGRVSFIDDGPDAPTIKEDATRTFWYTVRAEDSASCEANVSGNSAPAYGVLRPREGPAAPSGELSIACYNPWVEGGDPEQISSSFSRRDSGYRLRAERTSKTIEWVEFYEWRADENREFDYYPLGRFYFQGDNNTVEYLHRDRLVDAKGSSRLFACRAGSRGGGVSTMEPVGASAFPGTVVRVPFTAGVDKLRVAPGDGCHSHASRDPVAGSGNVNPIEGVIRTTPGTKEWKLYRRLNDGPLSLIAQGEADYETVSEVPWEDHAMPAQSGVQVCYYAQLFDEHGNASPLERLADCVVAEHTDLPVPILSSPVAVDVDEGEGGTIREATLRWFAAPAGVERFEVWIGRAGDASPARIGGDLSQSLVEAPVASPVDALDNWNFRVYQTPRVAGGFGNGAEFAAGIEVEAGVTYAILVRAAGPGGFVVPDGEEGASGRVSGEFSNLQTWGWHLPDPDPGPEVPWPALDVPATRDFSARLQPEVFSTGEFGGGVAIPIGDYILTNSSGQPDFRPNFFPTGVEPKELLYDFPELAGIEGELEERQLLPLALYRVRVAREDGPLPGRNSANVVQVSPVLLDIAYEADYVIPTKEGEDEEVFNRNLDRYFIFRGRDSDSYSLGEPTHDIYLRDPQPVIYGAAYRYLLVRFTDFGEIEQVLVSPVVKLYE